MIRNVFLILIIGMSVINIHAQTKSDEYGLLDLQISNHSNEIQSVFKIVKLDDEVLSFKSGDIITDYYLGNPDLVDEDKVLFYKTYHDIYYPVCGEIGAKIVALYSERLIANTSELKRIRFVGLKELSRCLLKTSLSISEIAKLNTKPINANEILLSPDSNKTIYGINYNKNIEGPKVNSLLRKIQTDIKDSTINCSPEESAFIESYLMDKLRLQWSSKKLFFLILQKI